METSILTTGLVLVWRINFGVPIHKLEPWFVKEVHHCSYHHDWLYEPGVKCSKDLYLAIEDLHDEIESDRE